MNKLIILLLTVFTLGFTAIGQADMTSTQIMSVLNNGELWYMPNAQARFYDVKYLQIEHYIPETQEALTSVFAKDLTTKYIPELFDCDDIASVARAALIEEIASMLWAENVDAGVPIATVGLHNIYSGKGIHMINLIIYQNKAILFDFGWNEPWSKARLQLNNLAIGIIQF